MSLAGILAALPCGIAEAAPSDCSMAAQSYRSAIDIISLALRTYTNCLNASQGRDDCMLPFSRLKTAQVDFEMAVMDVSRWCD